MNDEYPRTDHIADVERKLKDLIRASDESLRAELVDGTTRATGSLRASGRDEHNLPGWYSARTEADIAAMGFPVRQANLAFPVPPESSTWHDAETDRDSGLVFRFFAGTASLSIERPQGVDAIQFRVMFGLTPEAILATEALCEGAEVTATGGTGDRTITIRFTDNEAVKAVRFRCPVIGVPAKTHPGATDERLLSAAIAAPTWVG